MRINQLGGYPIEQFNSPNQGDAMSAHYGNVLHIAEGTYRGTISWQMNPDQRYADGTSVNTCSTWIVGRNEGEWAQMVDTDRIAWCQRSGSRTWNSIELAGYDTQSMTEWQLTACAMLLVWGHARYGYPIAVANNPTERGLGHHSMDREGIDPEWGHDSCPGNLIIHQKPEVVRRALEGTEMFTEIDRQWLQDLAWRTKGILDNSETIKLTSGNETIIETNKLNQELKALNTRLVALEQKLAELNTTPTVTGNFTISGSGTITEDV